MFWWGLLVGVVVTYLVLDALFKWSSKRSKAAREWLDKDHEKQIKFYEERDSKRIDELYKLEVAIKTGKGLDKIKKELIELDKITGRK
jgi:hypothetical protein